MNAAACCLCRIEVEDPVLVFGRAFCFPCSEKPGVDVAGEWVRTQHGKRNAWAWVFGLFGLGWSLGTLLSIAGLLDGADTRFELVMSVACTITALGFWSGSNQARLGLPFAAVPPIAAAFFHFSPLLLALTSLLWGLSVLAATSPRSRLFTAAPMTRFRLEATYAAFNPRPISAPAACI